MGVEWLVCKQCGGSFPDCGDFVRCNCGERWCDEECAEVDGFRVDKEENDEYEEETSCKYCRWEDFEDYELLNYLLIKNNRSREDLVEEYKEYISKEKFNNKEN